MDRRGFLKATGAAAACAAAQTGAAATSTSASGDAAAPGMTKNTPAASPAHLASDWMESVAGPADMARRLAQRLGEALGTKVDLICAREPGQRAEWPQRAALTHRPSLRFGPVSSLMDQREAAYFAGLPGSVHATPEVLADWVSSAGGQEIWDGLNAPRQKKIVLAGHLGASPLLWSRRELDPTATDLRGIGIGADGLYGDLLRSLGAAVTPMSPADKSAYLSGGRIDAVLASPLESLSMQIPAHAPFAYETRLCAAGETAGLEIDLATWHALRPHERTAIELTSAAFYRETAAEARLTTALALETAQQRHGVQLSRLSPALDAVALATADVLIAELAASSPQTRRLDASYRAFARRSPDEETHRARETAVIG